MQSITLWLFVYDENISRAQQSTIEGQNSQIIVLEKRLAARTLSDSQLASLIKDMKSFPGQTFQLIPYWKNPESFELGEQIAKALIEAGWKIENPERFTTLVGVLTGVIVNADKAAPPNVIKARDELVSALNREGIAASAEGTSETPPSHRINMQIGIKP